MSAIQDDINAIRRAVYGKDVREAIADGIEQCYTDVSSAATLADTAASNANTAAAAVDAKLDEIPDDYTDLVDEVSDLKSALNTEEAYKSADWTVGTINSTTGANSTSTNILHTEKEAIDNFNALRANSGYKFLVFGYKRENDTDTFLGWWKNTAFYKGGGAGSYYVTSQDVSTLKTAGATHIRICLKNSNESDITVDAGINVVKTVSAIAENKKRIAYAETEINEIKQDVNDMKYLDLVSTNDLMWNNGYRVNSSKKAYASNATKYGYIMEDGLIVVHSGSAITVKSGYTMDYSIVNTYGDTSLEGERDVVGPATVTIANNGLLLLSVTDGVNDVTSPNAAKVLAQNALEINLLTKTVKNTVAEIETEIASINGAIDDLSNTTDLYDAQKAVAEDWHFPFIDVANSLGFGSNHQIPNTADIWDENGTADLDQKGVWMSDGVHPFKGKGATDMYALTIAQQFSLVSPSFRNAQVSPTAPYWTGKRFLWMGTSIPAGSDPDAGQGSGATYPALVSSYLGASVNNIAKGSSCVRANASDGAYTGFNFNHFIRSVTRMVDECDAIAANWDSIKTNILNAPTTLTESHITTMKNHSFENLLIPYLNGTNDMPDLFVIDYGHNDVRPKGIDGGRDLWVKPTSANISNGLLADDTYMTANNYANLKLAMNSNLSGISDIDAFAASVNRNCLQGALNFLITVILSRNPYARIALVSDYN